MAALNQQIAFHFGDGCEHGHEQLASGRGKINTARRMHDDANVAIRERTNRRDHIDGIAPEPIELRDDQRLPVAHLFKHGSEARSPHGVRAAADHVPAPGVNVVAGLLQLKTLVRCGHHVVVLADAEVGIPVLSHYACVQVRQRGFGDRLTSEEGETDALNLMAALEG
jgi:hypothetical protein